MKKISDLFKQNKINILVALIFLIGFSVRIIGITDYPNGFNCDEASIGYEAYSVLNYGIDRNGNSWPVFLEAWGSGQNALYMYIIMPFIKLFGLTVLSVRLPMALIGCISLIVMYKLLKENKNKKIAIIGLAFFAICPWHIMKSRYGLESNVFPDLALLAVYVFINGIKKQKNIWIYISAVLFGLCAYAYGTSYYFLPIFLIPLLFILTRKKEITLKQSIISLTIIFIISLPIILMLFINTFDLDPINIGKITIPRLEDNRYEYLTVLSAQNKIKTLLNNFKQSISILIFQNDGFCANTLKTYGIIYLFSIPITIIGLVHCYRKKDNINLIFNIWFIVAFILMFICEPNINRMNIMYIPLIYYTIIGINELIETLNWCKYILIAVYVLSFICFQIKYYHTDFTNTYTFVDNVEEVIKYTKDINAETIYFDYSFKEPYIYILFYNKEDTRLFKDTVKYKGNKKGFNSVIAFSNYVFNLPEELNENKNNAYIMKKEKEKNYIIDENKWKKTYIEDFVVIEKR